MLREAPVALRGAGVMVLQEGGGAGGPPAHHSGRLAVGVPQAPVLVALEDGVQDALGGDVEGGGVAARRVDPVDDPLAVGVLDVLRHALPVVRQAVPVLADRKVGRAVLHVLAHKATVEAAHVVQPPAVKADVVAQPLQPLADVVADKVLRVVDVGRRVEGVAGADVAAAVKVRVVRHDRVRVPVHPAAKLVPDAVGVLVIRAAMVEHRVAENLDAVGLQRLDARLQRVLAAVVRVERVEVAREVALRRHRVRGRRHPHQREARLCKLLGLAGQHAVPVLLVALPVEALQQDLLPAPIGPGSLRPRSLA
mmetsp:Transcript_4886/g.12249  ORF Transcript_4886/g.12249 Transcript_4886/m.12249 type:complete len:309 (+) Transcript_4886:447-1373(+)